MKKFAVAALALIAMASLQAQAQTQTPTPEASKGYVLAAAGSSHLGLDCTGLQNCKASGTGFKVAGGWRLNSGLAAEFGYVSFGKATGSGAIGSFAVHMEIQNSAVYGAAALTGQMGTGVTGTARLGLAAVNTKASSNAQSMLSSGSYSESSTKVKPFVGAALNYAFTPSFAIEAAFDATQAETTGSKGSVQLLSLGARFAF